MLVVNGHAKHRQSLCRVGYGKTALSMDLFFITTANILSTHTFLLLSRYCKDARGSEGMRKANSAQRKILRDFIFTHIILPSLKREKSLSFTTLRTAPRFWDSSLQNDKTTFCYRQVLQQQVKRSIAVGYAVWVAKSKTSQWQCKYRMTKHTNTIARVIFKKKPALCEQQLLLAENKDKEWGMFERWIILLLLLRE